MFKFFVLLFVACWLMCVLCFRNDITEEQKLAAMKYLENLEKVSAKNSWVDPNDIFRDVHNDLKKAQNSLENTPVNIKLPDEFLTETTFKDVMDIHNQKNSQDQENTSVNQNKNIRNREVQSNNVEECSVEEQCGKLKATLLENNDLKNDEIIAPKMSLSSIVDSIVNSQTEDETGDDRNNVLKQKEHWSKDIAYLNRWVNMFVNKLSSIKGSTGKKIISVLIDSEDLENINSDLNSKAITYFDVDRIISDVFSRLTLQDDRSWFDVIVTYWKYILFIITCFITVYLYVTYPKLTLFLLFISICTAWQWKELYEQAIARKHADTEQMHFPSVCKKHELGIVENFRLWFEGFAVSHGTCRDYYKAIMVDPFWEVTPSMAFSATVSKFIFYPLEVFAETANNFVVKLFKDLSLANSILLIMILIFLSFMFFQYRVRSIFFTIEPGRQSSVGTTSAVTNDNERPLLLQRKSLSINSDTDIKMVVNPTTNDNEKPILLQRRSLSIVNGTDTNTAVNPATNSSQNIIRPAIDLINEIPQNNDSLLNANTNVGEASKSLLHDRDEQSQVNTSLSQSSNSENLLNPKVVEYSDKNLRCLLTSEMEHLNLNDSNKLNSDEMKTENLASRPNLLSHNMARLKINDNLSNVHELLIEHPKDNELHLNDLIGFEDNVPTESSTLDDLITL